MAVFATYCSLCALPLQHDHYVRAGDPMLKIYRGAAPDGGHLWEAHEHPFPFGPEHAWLKDAVGLRLFGEVPEFIRGPLQDGALVDVQTGREHFVGEGDEEYRMLHAACWERSGRPPQADAQPRSTGRHGYALLASYQEQLFEFQELVDEGKGWALVDPSLGNEAGLRSRARIDALDPNGVSGDRIQVARKWAKWAIEEYPEPKHADNQAATKLPSSADRRQPSSSGQRRELNGEYGQKTHSKPEIELLG